MLPGMEADPTMAVLQEGRFACPGARVGHAGDATAGTGCSLVLMDRPARYAVHVGGGASSLRQVAAVFAGHSVTMADAFLVAGGSAYGLDAAGGVLRALEALGRGTPVGRMVVPAVPAAAVFDLFVGTTRPDAATGAAAVADARPDDAREGRVGAGSGCTVGKLLGLDRAMWGGVGVATLRWPDGLVVAALAVVNAFGNVRDPARGAFVAGARDGAGGFVDAEDALQAGWMGLASGTAGQNTTIGVVATNGRLDGVGCHRAAALAAIALPDCIRPCWTGVDGDVVFLGATGDMAADPHQVGVGARRALERAIVRAVTAANAGGGMPGEAPDWGNA